MTNSQSKKKTILAVALFVIVFGGLLALATVFDLKVSEILADVKPGEYFTNNPFGVIFECIGSWPIYLFLAAAFAIIFANTSRSDNKWLRILGSAAADIAAVIASYILVNDTVNYIDQHFETEHFTDTVFAKIVFIFIGIAIAQLIILPFTKMNDKTVKTLLKFAFVIIFAAALSNIIVNIIKNIANRPRFRTMKFFDDKEYSIFQPWYVTHPKWTIENSLTTIGIGSGKDAYRSFPSGHTCAAGTVYTILALPYLFNKYNTKKNTAMLYAVSIFITGVVAVSRIVCGAHFFSDVLVGGTIVFLSVMLGIKIFIKKDFQRV